ncbi:MAG TPA: PilZ domain-containing protein [Terriglobales bacterium]|nr:PilZ domain-containing protein [Terriglobales bacterium]
MNSPDAQSPDPHIATEERRGHQRHTVQVQIEIHPEDTDVPMRLETTDLSRGGCYVQMMMPFAVGARGRATLWLGDRPVVIHGQVVTCHNQFGNGVKFVEFEGQAQQLLDRYLSAITG